MRRILVIEDDSEQGAMLMRRLRQEELHCQFVGTLAEGRELCAEEEFDCVILDLGLPDSESDEATIAAIPELHWPVVVLTGSGNPNVLRAVRQTGASVVVKPAGELLIEKVWSQINWRRGGRDSAVGQQSAQRRLQQDPATLDEGTKVRLTLKQMAAIIGSVVSATAAAVLYMNSMSGRIDTLGTKVDALTQSVEKSQAGTNMRVENYGRWRDKVNINVRRLGEGAKLPMEPLEDHP